MMYGVQSKSRHCDCENCIYGDVADGPRKIVRGNKTIYQNAGSINCTCASIHNMTITDDGIVCSEYRKRQALGAEETEV